MATRTSEQTKKDVVETIKILCDYLEPARLDQVWEKVFVLAEEQWQAERSSAIALKGVQHVG